MAKEKNIAFLLSKATILTYIIIAIFAPFIAGDIPVFCLKDSKVSSPVLSIYFNNNTKMIHQNAYLVEDKCVLPLIPYATSGIDKNNQNNIGPFQDQDVTSIKYRHWLGTDRLGRDVASGLIYGTRSALKIGFISVFFAFFIGVSFGLLAGYFGDRGYKVNIYQLLFGISSVMVIGFYLVYEYLIFSSNFVFLLIVFCFLIGIIYLINKYMLKNLASRSIHLPIDTMVLKCIEIRKSIPGLFLVLALLSIFSKPSLWNIVIIVVLLGWTEFARFARAESMSIKQENYILSAKILGLPTWRILFRHVLIAMLPTLLVVVCFSISGAILLEATLSFLGIGLPAEDMSWGKLMAEGRNSGYWWLVVFPGLAIFILILSLNSLASHFQSRRKA